MGKGQFMCGSKGYISNCIEDASGNLKCKRVRLDGTN